MSDPTAEANGQRPKILWGITASVAAIRAVKLADCLAPLGAVQAIVTQKAKHFLPNDFSLRVPTFDDHSEWESWRDLGDPILHIELRRWADVLVVSPLTADALGKITAGICDNLLLSTIRAWDYSKPLIVAPAMNTYMWEHPLTARQLDQLREWGATVVDPVEKTLACNDVGMGALADAEVIAQHVADAIQAKRAAEAV